MVESRLVYLRQLGKGPALGPYQVEPATHKSIWRDMLTARLDLAQRVGNLAGADVVRSTAERGRYVVWWDAHTGLEHHLVASSAARTIPELWHYATAIARCRYLWAREPLPAAEDAEAMAKYWKVAYNTHLGAGRVDKAIPAFEKAYQGGS